MRGACADGLVRDIRHHGHGFGKRQAHVPRNVAQAREQVDVRAGQRAGRVDEAAFADGDLLAVEREAFRSADRRHRIRDKECATGKRSRAAGDRQHLPRHVMAVRDQTDVGLAVERGGNRAGGARKHRRHGVEEVREHPRAGGETGARLRGARSGMTDRDDDAHGDDLAQGCVGHDLGREREYRGDRSGAETLENTDRRQIKWSDQGRIVGALARRVEVRPLQVQAEQTGKAPGGDHRVRCFGHLLRGRRDQRRHGPAGAEPALRRDDVGDGLGCGAVVHHHAAAAVHLEIGTGGHEQVGAGVGCFTACKRPDPPDALRPDFGGEPGLEAPVAPEMVRGDETRHVRAPASRASSAMPRAPELSPWWARRSAGIRV